MKTSPFEPTRNVFGYGAFALDPSFQVNSQKIMAELRRQVAVQRALDMIKSRMQNPPTLNELASLSGFSRTYFSYVFRKVTGLRLQDYLIQDRLNKAKDLLKNPALTIKKVAYEIGFRDPNYFCRVFKNDTGLNPTNWRLTILTKSRRSQLSLLTPKKQMFYTFFKHAGKGGVLRQGR